MNIGENIQSIRSNLPQGCRLIAVSKTQSVDRILEAYRSGQRLFGENKVQELVPKYEQLPKDIEWHMIGHLQSNKVKYIAPFVSLIHGVDSRKLLEEINKQGQKHNRIISCLLQVHIASEETKFGFSETELQDLVHDPQNGSLTHVRILGLMGMASFTENTNQVRSEFAHIKQLFDKLAKSQLPSNMTMKELSIGMSGDYPIAIENGSTLVRVGTAIFGERNKIP